MSIPELEKDKLAQFFSAIAPFREAYRHGVFQYVAVKRGADFVLTYGRLRLKVTASSVPFTHFISENIRAGQYTLNDLGGSPENLIEQLSNGKLITPDGDLLFLPDTAGGYSVWFTPFHPEGLAAQNRLNLIRLIGIAPHHFVPDKKPEELEWELKGCDTPFQDLSELMFEYALGAPRNNDPLAVDVIAETVAFIRNGSTISSKTATINLSLAEGLDVKKVKLGFRVVVQQQTVSRSFVPGEKFTWQNLEGFQVGTYELAVPEMATVHCIVSYAEIAQHHFFLVDPAHVPNPLRAAYEAFDPKLERLIQIISSAQGRDSAGRDLEAAVAWLLWMHGFQVSHIGGTRQMHIEGPDLIVFTPTSGHFAVIECTTGLLGADKKMPNLVDRAAVLRRQLDSVGQQQRQVLKVMVTSKRAVEIEAERADAERLGVLVLTREDLDSLVARSLGIPNAERLFSEALDSVRTKMQPGLPGLSPVN